MSSFQLVRGDHRTLTLTVIDKVVTSPTYGQPVDISASVLRFTVRSSPSSDVVVFAKNSEADGGIEILDTGADDDNRGKARITFTDADWDSYVLGGRVFAWDIQETRSGETETILGTPLGDDPLQVIEDVTRVTP